MRSRRITTAALSSVAALTLGSAALLALQAAPAGAATGAVVAATDAPTTTPSTTEPTTAPTSPTTAPTTEPTSPTTPPTTTPPAPAQPFVQRVSGSDRYVTGVKVSQQLWADSGDTSKDATKAQAVVLATGEAFPDALTGGPLAAAAFGPLLLTEPNALPDITRAEIQRVLPAGGTVYVLGGKGAVSDSVADQLGRLGYQIHRLGGADRFATARVIAGEVQNFTHVADAAVVATGQNFADALSAGSLAALTGAPIVLTDGSSLDQGTAQFLDNKGLYAVGGPAFTALGFTPNPQNPCLDMTGADRYTTSANVAGCISRIRTEAKMPAAPFAGVATGTNYPDALTGGAFMAVLNSPLLLTDPAALSWPTADTLSQQRANLRIVEIYGGTGAVGQGVENSIVNVLGAQDLKPLTSGPATGLRAATETANPAGGLVHGATRAGVAASVARAEAKKR